MMRFGLLFTAVAVAASLAGCSGTQVVQDAGPAITTFHKQLDAGSFDAIWKGADPGFRQTSEADLVRLLGAVHTKLGNVVKSEQTGWNVNYGTGGKIVTIGMATTFQHGTGTEQFVFRGEGDKLALYGYNINSADMMLK